jgi:hypothetical protein
MKVSILAWVLFSFVGYATAVSWSGETTVVSEPVRMVLWGLTLILFSSSLRTRKVPTSVTERAMQSSAAMTSTMGTSLARSA